MKRARSPSLCSILPGSPSVARRTRAEKHRDKLVSGREREREREGGGGLSERERGGWVSERERERGVGE